MLSKGIPLDYVMRHDQLSCTVPWCAQPQEISSRNRRVSFPCSTLDDVQRHYNMLSRLLLLLQSLLLVHSTTQTCLCQSISPSAHACSPCGMTSAPSHQALTIKRTPPATTTTRYFAYFIAYLFKGQMSQHVSSPAGGQALDLKP